MKIVTISGEKPSQAQTFAEQTFANQQNETKIKHLMTYGVVVNMFRCGIYLTLPYTWCAKASSNVQNI